MSDPFCFMKYIFTVSVSIKADPHRAWEALTKPDLVKLWNSGTEITTDWMIGSPIKWEGTLGIYRYVNKGTGLSFIPGRVVRVYVLDEHVPPERQSRELPTDLIPFRERERWNEADNDDPG